MCLVGILVLLMTSSGAAYGLATIYTDESAFKAAYAGTLSMESFETIPIDSWIYDTRLPSPILAVDPGAPDYDLDGHFSIIGNSLFGAADQKFWIVDGALAAGEVDGDQFLQFSPWYNFLWPSVFDPLDPHPIVTFDNFNNNGAAISAFGLYLYNHTPVTDQWIAMTFGDQYIVADLTGPAGSNFFGAIFSEPATQVQLHTNQNGGSIKIDEVYFSGIPEPGTIALTALGLFGLALSGRRRAR